MEKLIAWLNKHDYTHKPAFFGDNYFYNVPEIKTEAAEVVIISKKLIQFIKIITEQSIIKFCLF